MSNAKHTPGPWGVSSESPNIVKQYDCFGETRVIIGSASGYTGSACFPTDEEAVHNARLIAAAPELLNAVEKQHRAIDRLLARLIELDPNFYPTKSVVWPLIESADAVRVIAKAKGEQPC